MRKNELQFESHHEAGSLIESYNPDRDEWVFPQVGDFWDAIKEAHKWGHRGEGKTIAIIDSSFDLGIPKLRAQEIGAIQKWAAPGESKDHGTAVALLIATVAPSSRFDLYEVSEHQKPNRRLVVRALKLASQSEATLINLSIGRPVDNLGWWDRLWRTAGHCELCRAASIAAFHGKLVIAAVGNAEGEVFCPARDSSVLGIGFQRVVRTVIKTQEGGESESAYWEKPSYPQGFTPDYTVTQPGGVLGSSFAAPLITGALTLIDDTSEVPQFLEAAKIGGIAESMHAALRDSGSSEGVDMMKQLYIQMLTSLPHRHIGAQGGPPCIPCSIFAENLYVNAGLFFLESGQLDLAEELLSAARWFAPWSPHAAANLATLLRSRASNLIKQGGEKTESLRLLRASRDEYQYALKLRPNFEPYLSGLKIVDDWLSSFPNTGGGGTTKGHQQIS